MMRRFLFHLHSVTGLIAGLCLIVIGLTGSILVFREEIDSLMMPKRVLAAADRSAPRLGLDALIARVEDQLDSYEPVGWRPSRSPARNDQIFVAPHAGGEPKTLWVDPATGIISGSPVNSSETVTGWLLELHYTLLSGHVGVLIAGVFGSFALPLRHIGRVDLSKFLEKPFPPALEAERAHFLLRPTQDGGDLLRSV